MPTTRPGYIWSGTEWVAIGQEAIVSPFYYQATAPSTPSTGDIWVESDVDVPSIDSTQFLRWRKTAVGGETSLSGNDDNNLPLKYTPNYEQVYINGVLQVRGQDYTATTGTTITGLTALAANDVVEVFSVVARVVADVYTQAQSDSKYATNARSGLTQVVPSSVTVSSGSASVGTNGQVTLGSGVTSVTLNGVFSSTYDNYRVFMNGVNCSVDENVFYLKLSGSTGSTYSSAIKWTAFPTGTFGGAQNSASANGFICGLSGVQNNCNLVADLFGPFTTNRTAFNAMQSQTTYMTYSGGQDSNAASSTGLVITAPIGGFTFSGGTIRIYGYNNGA